MSDAGEAKDAEDLRRAVLDNQKLIDDLNRDLSRRTREVRIIQEIAAELNATLGPLVDERDLQSRFAAAVSSELAHRRSVAPTRDRADAILALRLHGLEVQQHARDRVSLRMTAAARVESGGENPGKPRAPWRATEHETPPRPFRDWVTSDGRALLEDLDAAIEEIADDVVRAALRPHQFGEARP